MTLWKKSNGKLIKNASGNLVSCETCPCDEECTPTCSVCSSPQSWTMTINSTSTGCDACEATTLSLTYQSDCNWGWSGSYPQSARVEYLPTGGPGSTPIWRVSFDLSVCLDCDPCENDTIPESTICYTTFSIDIDPEDWNCCSTNTITLADGDFYTDCALPCTFPSTITLTPVGACCEGVSFACCDDRTFPLTLNVTLGPYSFEIEWDARSNPPDEPDGWYGSYYDTTQARTIYFQLVPCSSDMGAWSYSMASTADFSFSFGQCLAQASITWPYDCDPLVLEATGVINACFGNGSSDTFDLEITE